MVVSERSSVLEASLRIAQSFIFLLSPVSLPLAIFVFLQILSNKSSKGFPAITEIYPAHVCLRCCMALIEPITNEWLNVLNRPIGYFFTESIGYNILF